MNNTFKIVIFFLPFYFLHQSYASVVVDFDGTCLFLETCIDFSKGGSLDLSAPTNEMDSSTPCQCPLCSGGKFSSSLYSENAVTYQKDIVYPLPQEMQFDDFADLIKNRDFENFQKHLAGCCNEGCIDSRVEKNKRGETLVGLAASSGLLMFLKELFKYKKIKATSSCGPNGKNALECAQEGLNNYMKKDSIKKDRWWGGEGKNPIYKNYQDCIKFLQEKQDQEAYKNDQGAYKKKKKRKHKMKMDKL